VQDYNDFVDFIETSISTVARLADLLESAQKYERSRSKTELARQRTSAPRKVIAALDKYLIGYRGKGLVRASEKSKGRGLATASKDFASFMLKHILGEEIREISDATIDDAIKDVITSRGVGSRRKF
jgi:hypothetical protein